MTCLTEEKEVTDQVKHMASRRTIRLLSGILRNGMGLLSNVEKMVLVQKQK